MNSNHLVSHRLLVAALGHHAQMGDAATLGAGPFSSQKPKLVALEPLPAEKPLPEKRLRTVTTKGRS
jgi:hypothetical protein